MSWDIDEEINTFSQIVGELIVKFYGSKLTYEQYRKFKQILDELLQNTIAPASIKARQERAERWEEK